MDRGFVSSPHSARINRVDWVMLQVSLALIPGTLALVWFFGWGVLINMGLAVVFAVTAEALVRDAESQMNGLDIVVSNAGITRDGLVMRMSDEDWRVVIEVNLEATPNSALADFSLLGSAGVVLPALIEGLETQ